MPLVTAQQLEELTAATLGAAGATREEAAIVARGLVDSNLVGHDSHGVVRLERYIRQLEIGELVSGVELRVERETAAAICCDGQLGFGQVQAQRLLERAAEKARTVGCATATMRHSGHVGRLGAYPEAAASSGLAALMAVNDNGVYRIVAPPGGIDPAISTNPVALAVPSSDGPIVLDFSTSVVAQGKVLLRRVDGGACPEGWLQDAEGVPTTDPMTLLADPPGTILPLGGVADFKGFGLGLLLDMLVGGLTGGSCPPGKPGGVDSNNVLLVVWDPQHFAGSEHLVEQVGHLAELTRGSRRKPDVQQIVLPGDRSSQCRAQRQRDGIPLGEGTWETLLGLARQLDVQPPTSQ